MTQLPHLCNKARIILQKDMRVLKIVFYLRNSARCLFCVLDSFESFTAPWHVFYFGFYYYYSLIDCFYNKAYSRHENIQGPM